MHNVHPSIYRKGIEPLKPSLLLNPIISLNFSRVGLSPTRGAGDVASRDASDRRRRGNPCVDHVVRGPPIVIKMHVVF